VAASHDVEIVEVDPKDDAAFAQWFAVHEANERLQRPGEPGWLLHEQQQASIPDEDHDTQVLAVVIGGRYVGAARLEIPQKDNEHLVEAALVVHPDARRRGIGRALDDELVRRVRALGRSTVLSFCDEPPGGDQGDRQAAVALGYKVVQTEVRRDIDLPLEAGRVAALERETAAHAADYDVVTWWDRCPDELLEDCAALNHAMSLDVPKDEMDWREELWDGARLRRNEDEVLAADRTYLGTGAVHRPSGRMVAFTTMGVPRAAPQRAYQWETLVLREHRGHRLGMLLKLSALQELHAKHPQARFISTWNAKENAPMIAVNDALGARTNGGIAAMQKVLA
jgi:GNAT superfamily N-acetyltransferase